MVGRLIQVTTAYQYPLILKQLWHTPLMQSPDQEIVYRDRRRLTYRQLGQRIGRLASALEKLGVRPGDTVGVLDWDSIRFLEAFFAIPMIGAVLQIVNDAFGFVGGLSRLCRWPLFDSTRWCPYP